MCDEGMELMKRIKRRYQDEKVEMRLRRGGEKKERVEKVEEGKGREGER